MGFARSLFVRAVLAGGCLAAVTNPVSAQAYSSSIRSASGIPYSPSFGEKVVAEAALPPIGEIAPYNHWKKHTGKAEESVALLRIQTGDGRFRTVQGVVIRCDGFILMPVVALSERLENSPVTVSLVGTEGNDSNAPLPAVRLQQQRGSRRHAPAFALIKVNGAHVPSVPLLDPVNLRNGVRVRIVYAQPGTDSRCATSPALTAVVADPPEDPNAPRRNAAEWSLDGIAAPEGGRTTATPPLGASVVDADSGALLGLVTGTRAGKVLFHSFLYLHEFTNEVGLVPSRSVVGDRFRRASADGEEPARKDQPVVEGQASTMVWVPGGPVRLRGGLLKRYQDEYRVDVACTPGFWVDAFPVTNGEYRPFARTVLAADGKYRLPLRWRESNELSRQWRSDHLPVGGVGPEEAALYAFRQGKRLLTGVEFLRASEGAVGPWVTETLSAWARMEETFRLTQRDIETATREATAKAARLHRRFHAQTARGAAVAATTNIDDQTLQHIIAKYSPIFDAELFDNGYPFMISPIGIRGKDRSQFGVRDVVMNTPELVQPLWRQKNIELAAKQVPALHDPHLDYLQQTGTRYSHSTEFGTGAAGQRSSSMSLIQAIYSMKRQVGTGFRCAR